MSWTERVRSLTNQAVKQSAAALGQGIPADGQVGRLLRKLADEPRPAPARDPSRIFVPSARPSQSDRSGARTETAPPRGASEVATDPCGAFAALGAALPVAAAAPDPAAIAVGDVLAERYEIRRLIGNGPGYRVYAAWHRPWSIEVVLKVPRADRPAPLAPAALAQQALRWTAIGLHPHVVYCHYLDRHGELPLLVVEHRAGGNLRPWIASGRSQPLRVGLNLAIAICHGLERAHADGVWHGGLRPENLLLDADGMVAVADFGLAAAAHLAQADGTVSERRRRELEPYLAPEQWVDPAALDARCDLFALGVCLYELFTGRRPYDIARGPRRAAPEPAGALPGALTALLRRCVDWDAAQRPLCAREVRLALADLHRQLLRRPSPFAELPAGSWDADGWNNQAVALHLLGHRTEADAAWAQALGAAPAHLESTYNAGLVGWSRGELSDAAVRAAVGRAAARRPTDPRAAALLADCHLRAGDVEAALAALGAASGLDAEGRALHAAAEARRGAGAGEATQWTGHRGYVSAVQLVDGGARAITASDDGTVALWGAGQGAPLRVLDGHGGAVATLAVSSDGRYAVSGGDDATLRVWELRSGRCLKTLAIPGKVLALAVDAALSRVVAACTGLDNFVGVDSTTLLAFDLDKERPLAQLAGHTAAAKCVGMSGDGRLAVSGSDDHTVRVWDLAQGGGCRRVLRGHAHYVSAVAISADGSRIVSGSWDTTLRVWETQSGRCLAVLRGHEGLVTAVAISPDARLLVSGGWDRSVRVWDVDGGRCLRTFAGHDGIVASVAVSADGAVAASASWDRTARLWRLPPRGGDTVAPKLSQRVAYARLPAAEPTPDELLDDAETALAETRLADAVAAVRRARAAAQGAAAERAAELWRRLAPRCRRGTVRGLIEDATWQAAPHTAVHPAAGRAGLFEAAPTGALWLRDPLLERVERRFEGHGERVLAVAHSARLLVSAAADATLRLWDLAGEAPVRVLDGHASLVAAVALSADERWALSGSYDHTLRLWALADGRCMRVLNGHTRQVTAVAFDPLRGRALSGDYGGTVRFWRLATNPLCREGEGHEGDRQGPATAEHPSPIPHGSGSGGGPIVALRLSADGTLALSAAADGTVCVWDAASGARRATLAAGGAALLDADLSADGRWALAVDREGDVRVWDVEAPQPVATFSLPAPVAHARVLLDDGRLAAVEPGGRARVYEIDRDLTAPA